MSSKCVNANRDLLLSLFAAIALFGMPYQAHATVVATIDGCYDCTTGINGNPFNGGDLGFDTPMLIIHNTSGGDLINGSMLLQGYQGLNNGISQTVNLPTIGAGDTSIVWATGTNGSGLIFLNGPNGYVGGVGGSLIASDYDDSYGEPQSHQVGNFSVTLTAIISGGAFDTNPVFSVFSPTTNHTGGFVGWQGLDQTGLNETSFDAHSGTINGTLALIEIGTPPATTPLPAALPLFASGLGALGLLGWRRKKKAAALAS